MSSIVVFGGSGFVGTHLAHMLGDAFERVYIADIRTPGWHSPGLVPANPRSVHVVCDVREPLNPKLFGDDIECIVNLAAVHTSPGHPAHEYFETNVLGARHVCEFASRIGVNRIVFTSSISVYGPGEDEKTEQSIPMPAIPYGSSKIIAEYIHREWYNAQSGRALSVIRPAVIFGPGEGGNFTRIANALQRGMFAYPGRRDTIKSCLYVKDICRFIIEKSTTGSGYSVHNFCYPEKITIADIVGALKRALGYQAPEFVVPLWVVNAGAGALNLMPFPFIRRMGLVPERIVKLVKSTNVSSQALVASGFALKYPLDEALKDWATDCGGSRLY